MQVTESQSTASNLGSVASKRLPQANVKVSKWHVTHGHLLQKTARQKACPLVAKVS